VTDTAPLAAVHYFYLLKEDAEDLHRLWAALTAGAGAEGGKDEPGGQAGQGSADIQVGFTNALGLASLTDESGERCQLVQRVEGAAAGFCLSMLADLAVIEVSYRSRGGGLAEEWRVVSDVIESDRDRLLSGVAGIFGETTVMLAPAGAGLDELLAAAGADPQQALTTRLGLKGATAHGLLVHFPEMSADGRDYYAIAAEGADTITAAAFPQMDSLIKKLGRTALFFEGQRQTILIERNEIDRKVGELLHRQVVASEGAAAGATTLERQITDLSRMFGLLATDSLLISQSVERMSRDIKLLTRELKQIAESRDSDGIGSHYLNRYRLDLAEAEAESHKLDFSRKNAQAAIEVVRTQVEIMRAGEEAAIQQQSQEILSRSLVLQKERLALQVAAGFIEFVLVFYYVLKSWEGIADAAVVEEIPPLQRLLVVGGFSAAAAVGTHFLAQTLQTRSWKSIGLWISIAVLVLSLAGMVMLTVVHE